MAYADPVDTSTPGDSAVAGDGDNRIRELKRALKQRIESVFISIDDDPLKLRQGAVTDDSILDGTISGSKLAVGSIPADRLSGTGSSTVGAGSVDTNALQGFCVTNPKIASGAVDTRTLADGSVTAAKLAVGAGGSAGIADGAITRAKIDLALQHSLVHHQKLLIVPIASTILASGASYTGSTALAVGSNGHYSDDVGVTFHPEVLQTELGAANWADGLNYYGSVSIFGGIPTFLWRIHNYSGASIDISGKKFIAHFFMRLDFGPVDV